MSTPVIIVIITMTVLITATVWLWAILKLQSRTIQKKVVVKYKASIGKDLLRFFVSLTSSAALVVWLARERKPSTGEIAFWFLRLLIAIIGIVVSFLIVRHLRYTLAAMRLESKKEPQNKA